MLRASILLALVCALSVLVPAMPELPELPSLPAMLSELPFPDLDGFILTVDGGWIRLPVEPYYSGETLYIPLRAVSEALGASVIWDPEDSSAAVAAPGLEMYVPFGKEWLSANGRCLYVPGGVQFSDGVCMVPAETLALAFGAALYVNEEGSRAELTPSDEPITPGEDFYDSEELYWLSHIIYAEAGTEPFLGKIAVGNVVLNRVATDGFPDTVEEVIFDRRSGIQFSPAYSGSIYREPTEDCVRAAKIALEGEIVVEAALYFSPSSRAATCWASKHRPFITEIGRHVFFG